MIKEFFTGLTFEKVALLILLLIVGFTTGTIIYHARQDAALRDRPVDVLKDWTLTVDSSKEYRPGDVLPVITKFTKVVDIAPKESRRYVQCIKPEKATELLAQYDSGKRKFKETDWDGLISASQGTGSSPKGKQELTINLIVPFPLGFLPNICRVKLNPIYNVNKYHQDFPEYANSNPFKVVPRPGVTAIDSSTTYLYTDESAPNSGSAMINIVPEAGERIIIYQNPPATDPGPETPPSAEQPSLLDRVTEPVGNLLDRIL